MDKVEYYADRLKEAIKSGEHMHIKYKATNGWKVDFHGPVSGQYDENGGDPLVRCTGTGIWKGSDREIYVRNIDSLVPTGKPDYQY